MLDPEMVFISSIISMIVVGWGYSYGVVTQRTFALIGVPAICSGLAATIVIGMAPPPPPLGSGEDKAEGARRWLRVGSRYRHADATLT